MPLTSIFCSCDGAELWLRQIPSALAAEQKRSRNGTEGLHKIIKPGILDMQAGAANFACERLPFPGWEPILSY